MELNREQRTNLEQAVLTAIVDEDDLYRLVRLILNINLSEATERTRLDVMVSKLLEWTEARGRTEEFIRGLLEERPGHAEMRALLAGILPSLVSDAIAQGRLLGHATPYNPVFTGRTEELAEIDRLLRAGSAEMAPVPVAIHGMGGVGKSQTARRYVDRHREEYAVVCWVRGEKPEDFIADMAGLAAPLGVSPPIPTNQHEAYEAVKTRLDFYDAWLLIVDNAENLLQLRDLLPQSSKGRVLLTAREAAPPTVARNVEIRHFDDETGAELLLRRAELFDDVDALSKAEAVAASADLGGLALALEAAGAYIHARKISVAKYREFYARRRQQLHTDSTNPDHVSVTVTFSMALEQIERIPKTGKAAASLVRMCAFLAPDVIPDEVFLKGADHLEPKLAQYAADEIDFQDVIATATKYALIRREPRPSGLWMHRLAQEVVQDGLSDEERKLMHLRVVLALSAAFPSGEYVTWELCERLLPHALLGEGFLTDDELHIAETSRLLACTSWYLRHCARYGEAERLLRQALAIDRQVHGAEHPDVATSLDNLGYLLLRMGRYDESAEMIEEAVGIDRRTIGTDNPEYASHLDNLAGAYRSQGRYHEAAGLREQALDITKRHLGAEHPYAVRCLNNLANVCQHGTL